MYGGFTNIAPGLMGLWLSRVITAWGLGIAYVIWMVLLIIDLSITTPMIFNSPYHQLIEAMSL